MIAHVERWLPVGQARHQGGGLRRLPLPELDVWLLLLTLALCGLGLIMVYSASQALAYTYYGNPAYFFERQLLWLALGLVALGVCAKIDYHQWTRLAPLLWVGTLLLLVAVLVPHIGQEVLGARRWIKVGPFDLQPSVLAQFTVVVAGAVWLDRLGGRITDLRDGVLNYGWKIVVVALLVVMEKDLGSTIVLCLSATGLLWLAGVRVRHLAGVAVAGLLGGLLLIRAEPYRVARFLSYLNPFAHRLGTGFQAVQALYSLGAGGIFGTGLNGAVSPAQLLPEAHTDFIFAIIGEELGLVGTLLVLLLFLGFAWRGIRAARNAPDRLGVLLAGGITIWIVGQALINIGGVTDTIPSTGVPLTFISFGGSSLALSLAATGILLNISARQRRVGIGNARANHGRRNGRPLHPGHRGGGGAQED
ncbi:MAG TPA: putative lipid II flippase FtsW [Candidatus Dormibacteraeota bacterium]|nr:putative lipid II flippase FtsW [Candidatus Dormibacteraeota bacterium]